MRRLRWPTPVRTRAFTTEISYPQVSYCLAACAAFGLGGCDREVSGPMPQPAAVSPLAACNAQVNTDIAIGGAGFSPLPVDTLKDAKLDLPSITLRLARGIDGQEASADPVVVPNGADDPAASMVGWVSSNELRLQVRPELALGPGLYSVVIGNANGNAAQLPESLLITPPPTLAEVGPDIICYAHANTLTLRGDFFIRFGTSVPVVHFGELGALAAAAMSECRPLPGASGAEACRSLTVEVPSDYLVAPAGQPFANFAVSVENPATVGCRSSEVVVLTSVPLPALDAIIADLACDAQKSVSLRSQGAGFIVIDGLSPSLSFGATAIATVADASTCIPVTGPRETVQSCTALSSTLPQEALAPARYAGYVSNPLPADGTSLLPVAFEVAPPPTASGISPDLVCVAEGSRTLAVTGSGFLQVADSEGTRLPLVTANDLALVPSFAESDCTAVTGLVEGVQSCTAFGLELADTMPAATYALSIENPSPAGCQVLPAPSFVIVPPPSLTGVSPAAVCVNEGDVTLTVAGEGFLEVDGVGPTLTLRVGAADAFVLAPSSSDALSGCVDLGGTTRTVRVCSSFEVVWPQDGLASGVQAYQAVVTNPAPAGCSSAAQTVTRYGPPTVTSVSPTQLCTGGSQLTVTGEDLFPGAQAYLNTIPAANVTVADDGNSASVFFATLPIGTYNLSFANPGGCSASYSTNVVVGLGPVAFFADPPVVYGGMSTQITIYAKDLDPAISVALIAGDGTRTTLANVDDSNPEQVLAVVPKDTIAGTYHLELTGSGAGCVTALLPSGLEVVDMTDLNLVSVQPTFGWTSASTAVTIKADATGGGFAAIPRVYLNPVGGGAASGVALESVAFVDATTLTAVVPSGLAADTYDLIIVNPDATVGVSETDGERFAVVADPPPEVTGVSPGAVLNQSGLSVTVTGKNFRTPDVTLSCTKIDNTVASLDPTENAGATATSVTISLNASTLEQAFCIVRVTNGDETFGEFSSLVVTKLDQKLFPFTAGPASATTNSCFGSVGIRSSRATPPIGSRVMSFV